MPSCVSDCCKNLGWHTHIFRFQSKELMEEYGISSQRFKMATNGAEAKAAAEWLMETGAPEIVMKAQIFAGGRGKGTFSNGFKGGVQLSTDPTEVRLHACVCVRAVWGAQRRHRAVRCSILISPFSSIFRFLFSFLSFY